MKRAAALAAVSLRRASGSHASCSSSSSVSSSPALGKSFSSSQLSAAVSTSSTARASTGTSTIGGLAAAAARRQRDAAQRAARQQRLQQQQLQLQSSSSSSSSSSWSSFSSSSSLLAKRLAVAVPTALLVGGGGASGPLGAGFAACFESKKRNNNGNDETLFFSSAAPRVPARASRHSASSALSRLGLTPLAASLARLLAALAEEAATCGRAVFLTLLFFPAAASLPLVRALSQISSFSSSSPWSSDASSSPLLEAWSSLLASTLAAAGPAFIKWGQWAATRGDLFPPHVTKALRRLQSDAPRHSAEASVAAVEAAFGGPLSTVFDSFDREPVASGSVAQVHRATLSAAGAKAAGVEPLTVVAVKIRHPGAAKLMTRDFELIKRAAALCASLPRILGGGSWGVSLQESVRQFGGPLKEQLDLAIEAAHLARFNRNFRKWRNVSFPRPLEPLVTPGVLVESFESGVPISEYVYGKEGNSRDENDNKSSSSSSSKTSLSEEKRRDALAASLGRLGLGCYLQMLLRDNFVHADLHPGNILVRDGGKQAKEMKKNKTTEAESSPSPSSSTSTSSSHSLFSRLSAALGLPPPPPHLVLLDVGMAAELAPRDQRSLLRFFKALASRDGRGVGDAVLEFATSSSLPSSREEAEPFLSELGALFDSLTAEEIRERTPEVFNKVLASVREHGVSIRADVSSVVASALVLEGWSSALDPDIRILERVKSALPLTLRERVERWGDQMVTAPALF